MMEMKRGLQEDLKGLSFFIVKVLVVPPLLPLCSPLVGLLQQLLQPLKCHAQLLHRQQAGVQQLYDLLHAIQQAGHHLCIRLLYNITESLGKIAQTLYNPVAQGLHVCMSDRSVALC